MEYKMYEFDFEKLDVYNKAIKFTDNVFKITLKFRKEIQYSLGDQFRRASLSICNNLAEGSRKTTKGRKQFYYYTLDSARECIPMISLSVMQNQVDRHQEEFMRSECLHICNMLYKLNAAV